MTIRTKLTTLTVAALATLTLAGCSTGPVTGTAPENPMVSEWVSTPAGDVSCLVTFSSHGFTDLDCDWTTLTDPRTHTTENSRQAAGAWTFINQKEVFCLFSPSSHGFQSTDCNWEYIP